jgi:hypothetical protein
MANTLKNTLNKVGNAIEAVMGGAKKSTPYNDPKHVYTGQTCLERFGMEARSAHLMRNEWKRDLQYTKLLVDAEYLIQTEFKVSSYEDRLNEQAQASAEKAARKADKQAEKKAKKAEKDAKKAEKTKVKEERKESKETLYRDAYTSQQVENAVNFMRNQKINLD